MGSAAGSLAGRVAVVVGGHSGFGSAIAGRLTAEGATVVVAGRRRELVEEAGRRLGGWGWACDITDEDALVALVSAVVGRHGRLDVAVNCAGYQQSTPFPELTAERLRAMVEVQLVAAILFIRHTADAMAVGGGGSVVSMSSLTAHNPSPGLAAYASSKRGLEYATEVAAVEYGPAGVRVNCVAAHLIETPMTEQIFKNRLVIEAMREETPLRRMGSAADIAAATLYLCSDEGAYVSGQTLRVDGGASLLRLPTATQLGDLAVRRPDLVGRGDAGGP